MIPAKHVEYTSKYNLRRFVDAHNKTYLSALHEIRTGQKQSHWMWYIFPQLRGLGNSHNAAYYGIADRNFIVLVMKSVRHIVLMKLVKARARKR